MKDGLELVRPALSSAQKVELENTIKAGGFYKVRVVGEDGVPPVQVSIPARCLAAPGTTESFTAAVSRAGDLVGLSYDMSKMRCEPLQSSNAVSGVALSEYAPVIVLKAAAAPPVVKPASIPEVKRAAKTPQQGKEGGKEGVEGEEEAPPPDNRTWLQKNWIYMVPVIFILLNGLGGSAAQQRQGAPGQAAQAGGARQRARH
ncbi:g8360 [Coccomyxa elongata]